MATAPRAEQDALRQGAQEWAEMDPDRFGPYSERLNERFEELDQEAARRAEAGHKQRAAADQDSKARLEEDPDRAEKRREASEAAADRGDQASTEADRHGQAADKINAEEPAYDSAERREKTAKEMREAGVPEPQREAKLTADHLNAEHPRTAARSGQGPQRAAAKGRGVEQVRKRTKTVERSR